MHTLQVTSTSKRIYINAYLYPLLCVGNSFGYLGQVPTIYSQFYVPDIDEKVLAFLHPQKHLRRLCSVHCTFNLWFQKTHVRACFFSPMKCRI